MLTGTCAHRVECCGIWSQRWTKAAHRHRPRVLKAEPHTSPRRAHCGAGCEERGASHCRHCQGSPLFSTRLVLFLKCKLNSRAIFRRLFLFVISPFFCCDIFFQLVKNRTAIMITHRYRPPAAPSSTLSRLTAMCSDCSMTSVRYCDNVVVVLDGACAEHGPPSDLLQRPDR